MIRFSPLVLLVLVFCALGACEKALQPKPKAGLRLTYPEPQYVPLTQKLPFRFEYNNQASVQPTLKTAPNLFYPKLKATLYLSYRPIQNNLNSLLSDAYTLPSKHLRKADEIPERLFVNPDKKVYGTLFKIVGDAASQLQFFLTDSTRHFMVGALYFYAKPNYDSILPAIDYIEKDVIRLIETLEWEQGSTP